MRNDIPEIHTEEGDVLRPATKEEIATWLEAIDDATAGKIPHWRVTISVEDTATPCIVSMGCLAQCTCPECRCYCEQCNRPKMREIKAVT